MHNIKLLCFGALLWCVGTSGEPLAESIFGEMEKMTWIAKNDLAGVFGYSGFEDLSKAIRPRSPPPGRCRPKWRYSTYTRSWTSSATGMSTMTSLTTTTTTTTKASGSSSTTGSGSGSSSRSSTTGGSGTSKSPSTTSRLTPTSTDDISISSPCPGYLAQPFLSNAGTPMQLFCLTKFQYEDVTSVHTETFMECVTACDNYKIPVGGTDQRPCIAVTFTEPINNPGRNCYLKGSIHEVIYGRTRFSSAKKVSYPVPADIQVAVVELPFSTASALLPKPTRPIEPVDPCPYQDGSDVVPDDDDAITYKVRCGVSFTGNDLPSTLVYSFEECMESCNSYIPIPVYANGQGCVAITYTGISTGDVPNCYRKYAVPNAKGTNGNSASKL